MVQYRVSGVATRGDNILSGCYDGVLRSWKGDQKPSNMPNFEVLSSGTTEICRLSTSLSHWTDYEMCTCAGAEETSSTTLHSGPIKAVAVLPEQQGPLMLTAGQDHTVQLVHVSALDGTASTTEAATALAVYR